MAKEEGVAISTSLKAGTLLEQMRKHLETEEGQKLQASVGLVYQILIAPKVIQVAATTGNIVQDRESLVGSSCPKSAKKIGFLEESFVVDLKKLTVYKGTLEGKPDATFSFVDGDFISVATGKLNPQMAFIRGKMKVKGSLAAAQKFTPDIFPKPAKL